MIEVWKRGSYVYVCIIDLLRFASCWPKGSQPLVARLFCSSKNPRQFENVLCFVFTTGFNDYLQDYLKLSNVWLTYTLSLAIYLLAWENSDDTSLAFPSKWLLRNKPTNSILMTCHYPDLGSPPDWSCTSRGKFATTYQKHYPDLGSDTSSAWNLYACFSDVISRGRPVTCHRCFQTSLSKGNHWWRREM